MVDNCGCLLKEANEKKLDGLRFMQFDDIYDKVSEMVDCRSEMTEGKFLGVNETKRCVSSASS